jgi:hypothetical protein
MDFFDVRRARVRPGSAAMHPEVVPGVWMSASKAAQLVRSANRRNRRQVALGDRVLSDAHFEFRGGKRSQQQQTGQWAPRAESRRANLVTANVELSRGNVPGNNPHQRPVSAADQLTEGVQRP